MHAAHLVRVKGEVNKWIDGSKAMLKTGIGALHTMQPAEILVKDNRAIATTTISIRGRMNYNGCELDLESWAHQKQRFEKVDGVWKILRFEVIYVRDSVSTPFPGQSVPPMDEKGKEILEKARPSFKYLAWMMSLVGETVRNDLAGYDDEASWKPIVERNMKWLESGND